MKGIAVALGGVLVAFGYVVAYLSVLTGIVGGVMSTIPLYTAGASIVKLLGMFLLYTIGYGAGVLAIAIAIVFIGALLLQLSK